MKCEIVLSPNEASALVFSDIVVTPFIAPSPRDKAQLDHLFQQGHLAHGVYYLAGYPSKGPRAIMKLGTVSNLTAYKSAINAAEAATAIYFERSKGGLVPLGGILDVIDRRKGLETTVAEVWWFQSSPTAEQEWHAFMDTFAQQTNDHIFFMPLKPRVNPGPLDFSKPTGSDLIMLSMELCAT